VQLQLAGVGTREIAELVGVSQRRVQQIVRTAKQERTAHAE
jgi:DNA-directed RNA polymerase specialized sigma subunit